MAERGSKKAGPVRRSSLAPAMPSADLVELDLPRLRAYRLQLEAEEEKVSYWRRLVHARTDVLQAQSSAGHSLTLDDLTRALGDTATGRVRRVLLDVKPADPLPELPELAEMCLARVDHEDDDGLADALARLDLAERQLTAYRRALHERIDEATGELILRYREDPRAALALIPQE
ncbi:hypothetical protein [Nocardioides sp. W7]|uniref:RsiG family protein n=1 Tax=Nocardioides sp. W7 TaxID=2931390 RepID=UPI001FD36641|nr:hypothetical protein [Nocardioides sp. W7]